MNDPYVYEGTNILKNKFGLKDFEELNKAERLFTTIRERQLRENPIQGNFDYDHLKKIHAYIFQDIYDWAGKERTIDIAKYTGFCPVNNINTYADSIFKNLKENNYFRNLDPNEFSKKAAELFSDINELHPFREGNGRTQREFMRELSLNAGYELDLSKVPKRTMIDASLQGHYGLFGSMEKVIKANLKPLDSEHSLPNLHKGFEL